MRVSRLERISMKIPRTPHNWKIGYQEAVAVQKRLAARVREAPLPSPPRLAAGIDAAFSGDGRACIAGIVVWDLKNREVVEEQTAEAAAFFPYIPGLLTFREGPAVLAALRKLAVRPDVLLFDGQGIAHPRRLGIASHIGVIVGMPAVGCAKSRLIGFYAEPAERKGSASPLVLGEERIGTVLRTRNRIKPLFVSIGHLIELHVAEKLVLDCAFRYRLPEPLRLADHLVGMAKKRRSAGG